MPRFAVIVSVLLCSASAACSSPRNPDGYACERPSGDRCSEFNAQSQAIVAAGGFDAFAPTCRAQGGRWKRGGCTTRDVAGTCEAPEGVVHFVYQHSAAGLYNLMKSTCEGGTWRDRAAP